MHSKQARGNEKEHLTPQDCQVRPRELVVNPWHMTTGCTAVNNSNNSVEGLHFTHFRTQVVIAHLFQDHRDKTVPLLHSDLPKAIS